MVDAARRTEHVAADSTDEFDAWMDLVYVVRDQVGEEVDLRPIADRDGPFVVQAAHELACRAAREERVLADWTARVLASLNRPTVLDRCKELARQYRLLENVVEHDALRWHLRERIISSLKETHTLEQWCQGRLLALLLQRIIIAVDDRALSEWIVRAYLNGIVIHVYPQWRPLFHEHVFLFSDGEWLPQCGKYGRGVLLAAALNEGFFRFALLGELSAFLLLTQGYARQLRDVPLQRQVGFLSAAFSAIAGEVNDAFDETISQAHDDEECAGLLTAGAAAYCRRLLEFRWGRSERGLSQVTDWADFLAWCFPAAHDSPETLRLVGPHLLSILESGGAPLAVAESPRRTILLAGAPSGVGGEIADHYVKNGLDGLLGGVLGCEYLLRQLVLREDKTAYVCARAAFLELVKAPLDAFPKDIADGPGGSLARSVVTAVSGGAP